MALQWNDFKFERVSRYEAVNIRIEDKHSDWLQISITAGNNVLTYWCNNVKWSVDSLLEAFIDIIPEYAAIDKYFRYLRRRSRFEHDAESKGMFIWELKFEGYNGFEILVRHNADTGLEDDFDYVTLRDTGAIAAVKGNIDLCISIDADTWIKALLKALDDLYLAMPVNSTEDTDYSKDKFPQQHYNKLKLWLETPSDSYKWQKLNPGKRFLDNSEGFVIGPE